MLRLRWALLNNPSYLMHRLHIVIVRPVVALGVPWNHEQSFFLAGLCFFVVTVKKKEGSRGGGKSLRKQETGTETYGNSTCFPMFPKHVPKTLKKTPLLDYAPRRPLPYAGSRINFSTIFPDSYF